MVSVGDGMKEGGSALVDGSVDDGDCWGRGALNAKVILNVILCLGPVSERICFSGTSEGIISEESALVRKPTLLRMFNVPAAYHRE